MDMRPGTEDRMEYRGRNLGAFRSNQLMSKNSLPQDRLVDLDRAELVGQLERLDEVRTSVVARGKGLVADPYYPNRQIIRQLSRLLATSSGW